MGSVTLKPISPGAAARNAKRYAGWFAEDPKASHYFRRKVEPGERAARELLSGASRNVIRWFEIYHGGEHAGHVEAHTSSFNAKCVKLGIYVAPRARRAGVALEALKLAEEKLREEGTTDMQATVEPGNRAGARLFLKAGFVEIPDEIVLDKKTRLFHKRIRMRSLAQMLGAKPA